MDTKKLLVLGVVMFTVAFYILPMGVPSVSEQEQSFSAFKDDPNDVSFFRNTVETSILDVTGQPTITTKSIVSSATLLNTILDPTDTLYMAIGVEREFDQFEIDAIQSFVDRGGKVVIADDTNIPNELSKQFGVNFMGRTLWDEISYEDKDILPMVNARLGTENHNFCDGIKTEDDDMDGVIDEGDDLEDKGPGIDRPGINLDNDNDGQEDEDPRNGYDDDLDAPVWQSDGIDNDCDGVIDDGPDGSAPAHGTPEGVDEDPPLINNVIVLNVPTALRFTADRIRALGYEYQVIANTSKNSYLDVEEPYNLIDKNDTEGSDFYELSYGFPVAVEIFSLNSDGRIIFIGDSSLFQNSMSTYGENNVFVFNLVRYLLPGGGNIVFDESRHSPDRELSNVYSTISFFSVVLSNPIPDSTKTITIGFIVEIVSFIVLLLLLVFIALEAGDKEVWVHRFTLRSVSRLKGLPRKADSIRHVLKESLVSKVKVKNDLTKDQIKTMKPHDIARLIEDPRLQKFFLEPQAFSEDGAYRDIMKRIRNLDDDGDNKSPQDRL